jgi:hypothetical protein
MFRNPDTFNKLRYVTSEVADNKLNNIDKQQKFYWLPNQRRNFARNIESHCIVKVVSRTVAASRYMFTSTGKQ